MTMPRPLSLAWLSATCAALLGACASSNAPPASAPSPMAAQASRAPLTNAPLTNDPLTKAPRTSGPSTAPATAARDKSTTAKSGLPSEVRTRNAVFKLASYDDLPGWRSDDMRASWSAFRNSCEVLQKRDDWRDICNAARNVPPNTPAMRSFFESRFTLLRILNSDTSPQGEVTGYFEPLLEGQPQRDAEFNVPVMGVPRDLYTLDWSRVPKAQRGGVVRVRADGNLLQPATPADTATYALDLRRFELDDRDRRLRVRLVGTPGSPDARAEPYYTRAELENRGLPQGINAPVVIWVNDPLALYAMQVQGSGRIRLPDGRILRLQYAEQNGHPFKPLRVVSNTPPRTLTRGLGDTPGEVDQFSLEIDDVGTPVDDAQPLTRGGTPAPRPAAKDSSNGTRTSTTDPLVDELIKGARKPAAPASAKPVAPPSNNKRPAPMDRATVSTRLLADPSYVFFKPVPDRPITEGPQGALGVPLTPGRSVAVDPRVTPLGYPVFLSAPAPVGSNISMQRLVFAQDTGGAIRGAVRADYFWGFGSEAGQMARATRHRGQMWVLLPVAEAAKLASSKIVTRGLGGSSEGPGLCLVPDGEFCAEVD